MLVYQPNQIADIFEKVKAKALQELNIANENGNINELLEQKYGIVVDCERNIDLELQRDALKKNIDRKFILVFGSLAGGEQTKDLFSYIAKCNGIKNIEFISYEEAKRFNTERMLLPCKYSDIIIGSNPHMTEGTSNANSLLSRIKSHRDEYPNVIVIQDENKKRLEDISKTKFISAIKQTQYVKWVNEIKEL